VGSFDSHIGNVEHINLFSYSFDFPLQRAFGISSEEEEGLSLIPGLNLTLIVRTLVVHRI
jgi:hypothetical protein